MASASTSSGPTAAELKAERLAKLRDLQLKRVSGSAAATIHRRHVPCVACPIGLGTEL